MAQPTTRQQFKQYCLRQLGYPVIDINVDDEQVEDRIDDALAYYRDYHFDGTEKVLYKHIVTASDKTNGYITMPDNIIGVVDLFDINDTSTTSNIFSIRYQMHLNDLFDVASGSLVQYTTAMRHIEQIEEVFVGKQPFRFNRHTNRVYLDIDWTRITTGNYIIFLCYKEIDEDEYSDIWKDWWLRRYATQLIKRQWGNNLKKFQGMQMPGGLDFNGQTIYDEADSEIKDLEQEMITSFSLPVHDMIG